MCSLTLCCTQQTHNPGAGIGGTWGVLPFLALPVSIGFVEDASNVDAYQGHMFKGKNSAIIVTLVGSTHSCGDFVDKQLHPLYLLPSLPCCPGTPHLLACHPTGVQVLSLHVQWLFPAPWVVLPLEPAYVADPLCHHQQQAATLASPRCTMLCRRSPWTLQLRHHPR